MAAHEHHHGSDVGHAHDQDAVVRGAWLYDLRLRLWWGRRGAAWRSGLVDRLDLRPGQRALDVGSGTGQLAFALADRVFPGGSVDGVDAAIEMVRRADRKNRGRRPVTFREARAQELPFPDATFAAVTCTLALHHVAADDRPDAVAEMRRVLRPGGRLLIADFEPTADGRVPFGPLFGRGHAMHDGALDEAEGLLAAVGLGDLTRGPTSVTGIGHVVGTRPA